MQLKQIASALDYHEINSVGIQGDIDATLRLRAIEVFNKIPRVTVMLVSTTAGGEGIDLTMATEAIFYDIPECVRSRATRQTERFSRS